jgi:hypothetical protein
MAVSVRSDFGGVFVVPDITIDLASHATDVSVDTAVTVPGVLTTDYVIAMPPTNLDSGMVVQGCRVTAANVVTMRTSNVSAGTINPASSADWDFLVFRR